MSFRSNHYVPVLRLKSGELWALRYVASDVRESVTPILEVLPKNFQSTSNNQGGDINATVKTLTKKLWRVWGDRPFFLDTAHLRDSDFGPQVVERFAESTISENLLMIPVISLHSLPAEISALRKSVEVLHRGCCFRLNRGDLDNANTGSAIANLLARLEVKSKDVDLVVDLSVSTGYPPFSYIRQKTPELHEWRSFTVLSGAFPKDLQGRKPGVHRISRLEWRHWTSELGGNDRMPSFGDYTVQYAYYVEPPDQPNPSASIRYTSDAEWIVMRGEGIFNEDGVGNKQWPANVYCCPKCRSSAVQDLARATNI